MNQEQPFKLPSDTENVQKNDTNNLERRFKFHPAQPGQPEKYALIRQDLLTMAQNIEELCPDSPERNIAITKLEEAMFWANASIARHS